MNIGIVGNGLVGSTAAYAIIILAQCGRWKRYIGDVAVTSKHRGVCRIEKKRGDPQNGNRKNQYRLK